MPGTVGNTSQLGTMGNSSQLSIYSSELLCKPVIPILQILKAMQTGQQLASKSEKWEWRGKSIHQTLESFYSKITMRLLFCFCVSLFAIEPKKIVCVCIVVVVAAHMGVLMCMYLCIRGQRLNPMSCVFSISSLMEPGAFWPTRWLLWGFSVVTSTLWYCRRVLPPSDFYMGAGSKVDPSSFCSKHFTRSLFSSARAYLGNVRDAGKDHCRQREGFRFRDGKEDEIPKMNRACAWTEEATQVDLLKESKIS